MSRRNKTEQAKAQRAKGGVMRSLATAALVGGVRASAGRSGMAGMAGAFVFERVLRRSPLGALIIGAAMIGHDLYQRGNKARQKRQAHHAQGLGMASPPPEPGDAGEPLAGWSATPPPARTGSIRKVRPASTH